MSCKDLVEVVTDYLEGTLSAQECQRLEAHKVKCAGCINYVEQMRQTVKLLGHVLEGDVSTESRGKLLDAFRKWKSEG